MCVDGWAMCHNRLSRQGVLHAGKKLRHAGKTYLLFVKTSSLPGSPNSQK